MSKGKHEAANSGWQRGGDPFQEESAPKKLKVKKEKNAYGWNGLSKVQKAAVITGCCLAALIAVGVGWWLLFVKPPDVTNNVLPSVADNDPDRQEPDASGWEQPEEGDPAGATKVPGRKDDVYTFLLLGKDTGGGGNTDTMILVTYDVPNGTVDCLSIPRDTMINVTWTIKKINAVYASKRGIEGLKEEVGHLTGIVPDFHVAVEWEAIGKIVEALGGVEFDVPYNMDYDDPYQNLHIHQKKGLRKLSGDDAMQVIRWRKNNKSNGGFEIGDNGRQKIQQDFLKAVAKQCLQLGNWTKISQFAQIFFENVETDIKLENMLWFAQKAMGVDMENVAFHSMPGNLSGSIYNHQSYVFADPAGMVELVNEHFNPYSRDITAEDLQIMYKTKSGGLGVTNGTLASASMANPPVKSNSSTTTTTTTSEPKDTTPEPEDNGEAVLPEEGVTTAPGTTVTDPGSVTGPGTTTDPGTAIDPGTATDPGTVIDPGVSTNPGTAADPGASDPGTAVEPETPDPEPVPEPEPEPSPEPTPEPSPEPSADPEPVLPEE